jgi:valyl-tRNA synthetase
MSEISKAYEPQSVEDKWYKFWLDGKFFTANPESSKPAYSIVIPPPNVTGVLTMGHVLNNTIQDILSRKARMDGKEVLWLPGTDHAGIATQTVVERTLKKSGEIKHRDDLGRDAFLERVWQWKEKHGGIIIQQLKKLGASCDWSRERFTMDPEYSRCVQKVFVELYKKGLIYRGKRMVNWCPASLTALSDEEVIMKEQKGSLYYFKVEVSEAPGTFLTIATTRPETIPGDTAVAVNPKDLRYAHLIGKHILRPLPVEYSREQKLIPIIGDEHVDFEFGTGVLKVTPAHDKADYEIGLRHKLPQVDIMHPNGTMNELAGKDLNGLDRFKARKVAAEKLGELGVLEREEPYTNNVGFSERADVPIEPRLSEQWFLKYPSTEKARSCVEQEWSATVPVAASGVSPDASSHIPFGGTPNGADETSALPKMYFHPQRWAKVYDHWMGNIQDWCISRQLWWGHRVPVWRRRMKIKPLSEQTDVEKEAIAAWNKASEPFDTQERQAKREVNIAREPFQEISFSGIPDEISYWDKRCGVVDGFRIEEVATLSEHEAKALEKIGFTQDPDVLDTWFSSWLWPFATMGWPTPTATLKKFYPTTDLVTGPDIIFFWVARMIMAGYEFMGEMPFANVYFTGIIRDKQGRKMSKSLGNSPDPLDLIAKYGADALRFGVMRAAPLGQDILFDEQNVELGRNFCNKLWNACRFRQMQGGEVQGEIEPKLLTPDDKWILLKLDTALSELATAFADYKFSDATATLYRFFWSEYCDWYIEASKATLQSADAARKANTVAVIDFVLSHTLRMFHPFLPFITEELWHGMGYSDDMPESQGGKTIMFAPWPKPLDDDFKSHYQLDSNSEQITSERYGFVAKIRHKRSEYNIAANKRIRVVYHHFNHGLPDAEWEIIRVLAGIEKIDFPPNYDPRQGEPVVYPPFGGKLFIPLEGLVDVDAEKARLKKELEKIENEISKVEQKLANPNFTQKVPATVLEEHKKRLADWQSKREHARAALAALES